MKIKTKLTLGVGLLFGLIVLLGVLGAKSVNELQSDVHNILVANYQTLEYSGAMLESLEESSPRALKKFEENLQLQEQNITESGEREVTLELRIAFNALAAGDRDSLLPQHIRSCLFQLMDMNLQAIQRKSEGAQLAAQNAFAWIAGTGTLCFLIAFTLLVNLPASVADPVRELTDSIKQIAAENYAKRVHFESHSEYGDLARAFNTMAEKLEEYNNSNLARLMMEKKRIETLIDNMHDPVIGLDENWQVIFINEEAVKISGLPKEELLGRDAREVALQNDLVRTLINDLISGHPGTAKTLKIYAHNKEGYFEKENLHIYITPTGETSPALIGHVVILRNVTPYKELEYAKTNFIATISHEYKTPISSIKLSTQLLENEQVGTLNDEQKSLIDSIKTDTERLLRITGELLNMAQVESGHIHLSRTPVNPCQILQKAADNTRTQADLKHIRFDISCPDDLPNVQVDAEKTAWVLTNLISNAIQHSYDDTTVFLNAFAPDAHQVQFVIRDTGQGIAPQFIHKVFERYFRVPGAKKEGTGLGLSISKDLIEAQQGHIDVQSELGAGSTFTVTLPRAV